MARDGWAGRWAHSSGLLAVSAAGRAALGVISGKCTQAMQRAAGGLDTPGAAHLHHILVLQFVVQAHPAGGRQLTGPVGPCQPGHGKLGRASQHARKKTCPAMRRWHFPKANARTELAKPSGAAAAPTAAACAWRRCPRPGRTGTPAAGSCESSRKSASC